MKKAFVTAFLLLALSLPAVSPKRGKERLRELAVFPTIHLSYKLGFNFRTTVAELDNEISEPEKITNLRADLKREPENITVQIELGRLLDRNDETNAARVCFENAEQMCRRRIEMRPKDGLLLTKLGDALNQLGKEDEAESVYRRATQISTNEWRCWMGLGQQLDTQCLNLLDANDLFQQALTSPGSLSTVIKDHHPSAEAMGQAQTLLKEAGACFNRVVVLATNEPDALLGRAWHECSAALATRLIRYFHDKNEPDTKPEGLVFFPKSAVPYLQRAIQLSPKTYRLIALTAYLQLLNAVARVGAEGFSPDLLPDDTRRSTREAVSQLEIITQGPDKKRAAGALEALGFLKMTMSDSINSKADFKRAVALDPTREAAWDIWLGQCESPDEMVAVCESRLKNKDSAQNHLLLSKGYAKQEKWGKAAEQAELTLKREPNNLAGHLMLTALAIRQSVDESFFSVATNHMSSAASLIENLPSGDEKTGRAREVMLNLAILYGLNDDVEESKELLRAFLKNEPDDESAKDILSALE